MPSTFEICIAASHADYREVASLFTQYAESLGFDLGYQDFGLEVAGLPGKCAPPMGAILIAKDNLGHAVGCVGLRPLEDRVTCEMKRLFICQRHEAPASVDL